MADDLRLVGREIVNPDLRTQFRNIILQELERVDGIKEEESEGKSKLQKILKDIEKGTFFPDIIGRRPLSGPPQGPPNGPPSGPPPRLIPPPTMPPPSVYNNMQSGSKVVTGDKSDVKLNITGMQISDVQKAREMLENGMQEKGIEGERNIQDGK